MKSLSTSRIVFCILIASWLVVSGVQQVAADLNCKKKAHACSTITCEYGTVFTYQGTCGFSLTPGCKALMAGGDTTQGDSCQACKKADGGGAGTGRYL